MILGANLHFKVRIFSFVERASPLASWPQCSEQQSKSLRIPRIYPGSNLALGAEIRPNMVQMTKVLADEIALL